MSEVLCRATTISGWEDPEIGRIRRKRAQNKRNSYLHEGSDLRLTSADRNFVKSLYDSLLELYMDKRGDWGYDEMKFALRHFTVDEAEIKNLRGNRKRELQLIDWFEEISEIN